MFKCRLCGSTTRLNSIESLTVLHNYSSSLDECSSCGYFQLSNPEAWLEEAYSSTLNQCDTGIAQRNLKCSRICLYTHFIIRLSHKSNFSHLDLAGGSGLLVRLLRDYGISAFWHDPYMNNIFANGFESTSSEIDEYTLISAFEALEHTLSPFEFLKNASLNSSNYIFSTQIFPQEINIVAQSPYLGLSHGQHIGFFTTSCIDYLASKHNLHYSIVSDNYIFFTKSKKLALLWKLLFNLHRPSSIIARKLLKSYTYSDFLKLL